MIGMLALWVHAAAASPVVLHQGDENRIRSAVAEAANLSPAALTLTDFDDFRTTTPPKWSGQISMSACSGDPVAMKDIALEVSIAESRLMYMELDTAKNILRQAQNDLVCADSVVDRSVAARIGFLQGVISTAAEKGNDAWKNFTFSARFDPAMVWDDQYPEDGKGTWMGAKKALDSTDRIAVGVIPSFSIDLDSPQVFVNAAPVTDAVDQLTAPPGTNLLQIRTDAGVLGFNLDVESETDPEVFIPQLLPEDSLAQMTTEEGRQRFTQVVNHAYDAGTLVFVAHEDGIWRTAAGMDNWDTLVESPTSSVVLGRPIPPMAWVGTGLTAGALGGTIFALVKALRISNEKYPSETMAQLAATGESSAANATHQEWMETRQSAVGYSIGAGVGAALTVTGFVLTVPLF